MSSTAAGRALIGGLVVLHFLIGMMVMLPGNSPILSLPLVSELTTWYDWNSLRQYWMMFAPPPSCEHYVGVSMKFADGWTPMVALDDDTRNLADGKLILPRGVTRLATHTRHPMLRPDRTLHKDLYTRDFFQKLALHYLAGDGKIEGLEAIRFYSVVKGIEPFHAIDESGEPAARARDMDSATPLYERTRSDV